MLINVNLYYRIVSYRMLYQWFSQSVSGKMVPGSSSAGAVAKPVWPWLWIPALIRRRRTSVLP